MVKALRVSLAAVLLCAAATTADATVTRFGATTVALLAGTRGSAVAYDSVNQVYLAVSTFGLLQGRFIDKNGTPLGLPFVIQGNPAFFTHFPSVTFAPDADGGLGAFLVVWHSTDLPNAASLHTRLVSFSKGGAIGADNQVSVEGSYWERYAPVAYSTQSHQFLIVYKKFGGGVHAVRTDINGVAVALPFIVAQTSLGEDLASVAYNKTNNQFVVSYEGYSDNDRTGYVCVRAVQAGTDAPLGAGPTIVHAGGANFITDLIYNPDTNQYLVVWYRGVDAMLGRVVNADLSLAGAVTPISALYKAYDGLGLAYNPITQTSFMVSHCANCNEDGGVEIKADGTPVDTGLLVTVSADGKPNYYPRIAASTNDPNWLVVTSHNFQYTASQMLVGTASGPPVPQPNPQMGVNGPGAGVVMQPFDVVGWAIDLGSPSTSGADAIHVWAWPTLNGAVSGPPIFVGATTPSITRGDVGAVFGARFTNSGYQMTVNSLPGGSYLLAIYMHSTVTNTFNSVRTVDIKVSTPIMAVGTQAGPLLGTGFFVGGWSLDLAAPVGTGTGVDTIHTWAYPVINGVIGAPIWIGVANYGVARPDVAAIFGPQFLNSGFDFTAGLAPGQYFLAVFSHSSVAGTFNALRVLQITVQ